MTPEYFMSSHFFYSSSDVLCVVLRSVLSSPGGFMNVCSSMALSITGGLKTTLNFNLTRWGLQTNFLHPAS